MGWGEPNIANCWPDISVMISLWCVVKQEAAGHVVVVIVLILDM